jgi:cell division protein FtsI (penicillin-binding protein 3)/stage V sporulation protein D (sporulation-specific penicillin-binding protein)
MLALALAGALARAAWIQVVEAGSLARRADAQQTEQITISASRGAILDRNNVELATNNQAVTVFADPKLVQKLGSPATESRQAAQILGLDSSQETSLLAALSTRSSGFAYVARQAPADKAEKLERLKLKGFGYYSDPKRVYPQGSLAAQVIGYAGIDNRGLTGLELTYDGVLRGRSGHETVVRDPSGRIINVQNATNAQPGADLTLTIDNVIQLDLQCVLRATLIKQRALSVSAVVLDAHSGDVLAMATAPIFDANLVPQTPPQFQRNRSITDAYEPGSTFKLVTIAGALSDHLVTPETAFTLPYSIDVAGTPIHDSHPRGTKRMTVSEILTLSSNVGAFTISQRLGKERLARWIRRFGFGKMTGIDFPGESPGDVLPVSKWYGSAVGTIPIGQGIAVTPIQLAAAYAAIANGGVWVQPHLVERIGDKSAPAPKRRRVVSPYVASELMKMLRDVVDEGTGTKAEISGYSVAGKTGTANKPDPKTGHYSNRYVASFVGIVPASDPRLVILVTVDEPKTSIWGGVVAAPAFQEIALDCLRYLEIPPDRPS